MEQSSGWMETSVSMLAEARAGKSSRMRQAATQDREKDNEEPVAHAARAPKHTTACCRPSSTVFIAFAFLVSQKTVFPKTGSSKVQRQVMQLSFVEDTVVATVNTENKAGGDGIDDR